MVVDPKFENKAEESHSMTKNSFSNLNNKKMSFDPRPSIPIRTHYSRKFIVLNHH